MTPNNAPAERPRIPFRSKTSRSNNSSGRRARVARSIQAAQTTEHARLQRDLNAFLEAKVQAVHGTGQSALAYAEPGRITYLGDELDPRQTRSVLKAILYFLGEAGVKVVGPPFRSPEYSSKKWWIIPIGPLPDVETVHGYRNLKNPEMARRLRSREAVDVDRIGFEIKPGVWRLTEFIDDVDYASSKHAEWIYSIGRDRQTGEYFAALDGRFYRPHDPDFEYETVWLR
jgi:hypothetical protein